MKKNIWSLLVIIVCNFASGLVCEAAASVTDPVVTNDNSAKIETGIAETQGSSGDYTLDDRAGSIATFETSPKSTEILQVVFTRLEMFWQKIVIKYGLVIAVFGVVFGGFQMITAHGDEENYKSGLKAVKISLGMVAGLIIPYFLMDLAVKLHTTETGLAKSGKVIDVDTYNLDQIALSLVKILLEIAGGVAILSLVIAGGMWIFAGGNDELTARGKKTFSYTAVGLLVITFAYALVKLVSKLLYGAGNQTGFLEKDLFNATTYMELATTAMYVLAPAALVAILYAAYSLMIHEDADHQARAKKIILYAVLGLALSASSYALVHFLANIELF